jgi:hypothetical protein
MSNTMWKKFEGEIAKWMGTTRNPLSGRNNYRDDGEQRPGDVVTPISWKALIECKTRELYPKSGPYYRALDTLKEAKDLKIPNWFHFERKNGSKKIYLLATNKEWMKKICGFIQKELEKKETDAN